MELPNELLWAILNYLPSLELIHCQRINPRFCRLVGLSSQVVPLKDRIDWIVGYIPLQIQKIFGKEVLIEAEWLAWKDHFQVRSDYISIPAKQMSKRVMLGTDPYLRPFIALRLTSKGNYWNNKDSLQQELADLAATDSESASRHVVPSQTSQTFFQCYHYHPYPWSDGEGMVNIDQKGFKLEVNGKECPNLPFESNMAAALRGDGIIQINSSEAPEQCLCYAYVKCE